MNILERTNVANASSQCHLSSHQRHTLYILYTHTQTQWNIQNAVANAPCQHQGIRGSEECSMFKQFYVLGLTLSLCNGHGHKEVLHFIN